MQYYFGAANVLLLVFSLTDKSSLETAKKLRRFADSCSSNHSWLPAVLVGTKQDLEQERQVSFEEGLATAKELGCSYVETSAATNKNVLQAFHIAVRLLALQSSSGKSTMDLFRCGCASGLEKKLHHSAKKSVKGLLCKWTKFCNGKKNFFYSEQFAELVE